MDVPYSFDNKPTCLQITVKVKQPCDIVIRIYDANKKFTMYEDRWQRVVSQDVFYIKMPQSPQRGIIQVFNKANGNKPTNMDNSFAFKIKEVPLRRYIIPSRINNKITRDFVTFAQEFAEDASIISAGFSGSNHSIYKSYDGSLRIDYYDTLHDLRRTVIRNGVSVPNPNYGREVTTPMRTNADNGIIEVGKKSIIKYTVPMRVAILLHEFAHFYLNNKPEDEKEADFNALLIFLCLGYSKIAAYKAFVEVFKKADSPLNREREAEIKKFINDFDSKIKFNAIH